MTKQQLYNLNQAIASVELDGRTISEDTKQFLIECIDNKTPIDQILDMIIERVTNEE